MVGRDSVWRGGRSALARGVVMHDIIPTPPFRILSLTSSEKVSLFRSPATILGRKSPLALSKLGYSAQVGSPTMCGVFCIKVDNRLLFPKIKVFWSLNQLRARVGRW